jgi:hypothetical protein
MHTMSLRSDLCSPNTGLNQTQLDAFLQFLSGRLSASDYQTAEMLLHSTVNQGAAAQCHEVLAAANVGRVGGMR